MTVAIIDYGSGNLRSAAKAFESLTNEPIVVTNDAAIVARADRIVLPGVGAFADCRAGVVKLDGMMAALSDAVITRGQPFLGICVGMQLMATRGLEHGEQEGFDWIPGEVVAIDPADPHLKIPHMGWNNLTVTHPHPVLAGLDSKEDGSVDPHCYFVHGYHLAPVDPSHVLATVDYGGTLTAAVGRDNMVGTQFHPEKSQAAGLRLIANFLAWNP
jgi:imidazole glycerol-phosphate synthase subunit HisH